MKYDEPDLPLSTDLWVPGNSSQAPKHEPAGGAHGTEPETGLSGPESQRQYIPGSAATADPWDVPGGSHGRLPEPERELPQIVDTDPVIYQDPDDPELAVVVTDDDPHRGVLNLDAYTLDTEGEDFLIVPQD